jgi:hypothetical protein
MPALLQELRLPELQWLALPVLQWLEPRLRQVERLAQLVEQELQLVGQERGSLPAHNPSKPGQRS